MKVVERVFGAVAEKIAWACGTYWATVVYILLVAVWVASGPILNYSDTWQLYANTGTTLSTGGLVFILQYSQNRNSRATHLKLDEIIRALEEGSNQMIAADNMPDEDLRRLEAEYRKLAEEAAK